MKRLIVVLFAAVLGVVALAGPALADNYLGERVYTYGTTECDTMTDLYFRTFNTILGGDIEGDYGFYTIYPTCSGGGHGAASVNLNYMHLWDNHNGTIYDMADKGATFFNVTKTGSWLPLWHTARNAVCERAVGVQVGDTVWTEADYSIGWTNGNVSPTYDRNSYSVVITQSMCS